MSAISHIAILIPARDEAALLPRCLQSIQAARRHLPSSISTDVVLVADTCADTTAALASTLLGSSGHVLEANLGNVGAARALAASTAFGRSPHAAPSRLWFANTDADCEVPLTWLADQLHLARSSSAVAVAGIIDVNDFTDHGPGVPERFRETYLLHPDGTHPHVHGANLGVRGDAYLQAGGWAPRSTGEDHDLWQRLRLAGLATISPSRLCVLTSGRRVGRAPNGFAEALAAHNSTHPHLTDQPELVSHPG